jgi:hypothetical protein
MELSPLEGTEQKKVLCYTSSIKRTFSNLQLTEMDMLEIPFKNLKFLGCKCNLMKNGRWDVEM